MKTRLLMNAGTVACLALLAVGCSEVPFMQVKETQAARDEAREIALTYAPDEYEAALAVYDQAILEIETQAGKSGFARSYGRASELLAEAKQGFIDAREAALAGKQEMKAQAEEKSQLAATVLEETQEALKGVRRTSRNRADRERWRQSLEAMTYSLEDANDYMASEYYREAIGYFDTILQDCETIQSEISGA